MVWGVFTDKHVDANCRTVNLMFFFKLPYFGLVNCRTQSVSVFANISVKSRSLQIKLHWYPGSGVVLDCIDS